jgi:hypothetical protein
MSSKNQPYVKRQDESTQSELTNLKLTHDELNQFPTFSNLDAEGHGKLIEFVFNLSLTLYKNYINE